MVTEEQLQRYRATKREWHRNNRERSRKITQAWKEANPGAIAKYNAAYRCTCKLRTPKWADPIAINDIYQRARAYGLTVDHIVRLRGKNVCGLHVENNLRLLPHAENARKRNYWRVEG